MLMSERIDYILRCVGILLLVCTMIRYLSFYFLYFRSRTLKHSNTSRVAIGPDRLSAKIFYKIDFPVPARLEWLRKASNVALYLSLAAVIAVIFLIILEVAI